MSKQVFISYARSSSHAIACAVRDTLENAGVSVFLDERDIAPGSEFPQDIADALLQARLVLIFADQAYFERPWCVYEYRVALAPLRAKGAAANVALGHVVIVLPPSGDFESVGAHLPPTLATRAWHLADQHDELVGMIQQALVEAAGTIAERLEGIDDEAVKALRTGGSVPRPSALSGCPGYYRDVPASLKERFIGRADVLWGVFHALETRRAGAVSLSCAILGGAGSGKTQLAAEYLWRYGPKHYPGGLVWIDADCDDVTLRRQLGHVLKAFAPKVSVSDSAKDLADAIERAVAAVAREQAVLWIVDNIPEPTPGSEVHALSSWCPAWRHVSLLCTSRWEGIGEVDTKIHVDELSGVSAIELLTQSPVEREWLSDEQWMRVVEWVGGLPLALEALRVSLAAGFVDATELLARANQEEPAAAVDAEVEALRGEVAETNVRGVTKALQISYERMAKNPTALQGAQLLARLSPYPIASTFLSKLVGSRERGILANRSWLQSTDPREDRPGERYWRMHRIYSSYLRGRSADPDSELGELARKIQKMCEHGRDRQLLEAHSTHLVVLIHALQRRLGEGALGAAALDSARQLSLALATGRIAEPDRSAVIRSHGAELADSLGVADEVVERLRKACRAGDEAVCGIATGLVGHMPGSRAAAEFLVELLHDPRDRVRQQALKADFVSRHADILALPALEAILSEPASEQGPLDTPIFFSNVFEHDVAALPEGVVSLLAERLGHEVEAERRRALSMLQSIYSKMTRLCEPGDPKLERIVTPLREAALNGADSELAGSAARTLANPGDPPTYEALVDALQAALPGPARVRAVEVLGEYLRGSEEQELPAVQIEWRDGQQFLQIQPPNPRSAAPELFEPLVQYAVAEGDAAAMERALWVLLESDAGEQPLMDAVERLVEAERFQQLTEVAEAVIRVKPDLATGYWWRGIAAERLDRPDEAIADYGRVIERSPQFDQAYSRRADLLARCGDVNGAMADIEALIELDPDNAEFLFRRARLWSDGGEYLRAIDDLDAALAIEKNAPGAFVLKGECLIHLDRPEDAIEPLSKAIELAPSFVPAWHLRGWARAQIGQLRLALDDVEQVYALEPAYESATELRDALRAECQKLPPE